MTGLRSEGGNNGSSWSNSVNSGSQCDGECESGDPGGNGNKWNRVDLCRRKEKKVDYKRKVIIKRPDEQFGHVTNISTSLKNLQKTVDGYIETVTLMNNPKVVMICNEEGKLQNLQRNFRMGTIFPDIIRGTVIICGADGDDLSDIPISFDQWKKLLEIWGN